MPANLVSLRIAGFKSFAEPVSLALLPGLSGVIGPNGCGKSNVVDALRWAMGEANARAMRGAEMEDVIFAGTAHRASRNIAEVVITLEPSPDQPLPPPHDTAPELVISRRIERGMGSTYRVNGREVRARDVQTLFADLASGARASAMVTQGRIGALITARPEDRRAILEEAAGITGLHARRHEAELKLRAAEANLGRAEDLRIQLDTQLQGLKRQARQAARYRNLSGALASAEAELLAIGRARVLAAARDAITALEAARRMVAASAHAATQAEEAAIAAATALPALREREASARSTLERARLAREQIAEAASRAVAALQAATSRASQTARDLGRATQLQQDSTAATARLHAEEADLVAQAADLPARIEQAAAALAEAQDGVHGAEADANRATEQAAQSAARGQSLAQSLAQAEQRLRRLTEQAERLERSRAEAQSRAVPPETLAAAEGRAQAASQALADSRAALEAAERDRQTAQNALDAARAGTAEATALRTRLAAECQALTNILGTGGKNPANTAPLLDRISVPSGLEAALGAALGDELLAGDANDATGAESQAPRHWRLLPDLPAESLPDAATPLATRIGGPAVLARRLGRVGLVESPPDAATQADLRPGQMLVSRNGGMWRWDGYTQLPGAPSATAVRLQTRNRLAELTAQLAEAQTAETHAQSERAAAEAAMQASRAAETAARTARQAAEQGFERARAEGANLAARAAQAASQIAALAQQSGHGADEQAEAEAALAAARAEQAALPDITSLRAAQEAARATLTRARAAEQAARDAHAALLRAQTAQEARRAAISRELADWTIRAEAASAQTADLAERADSDEAERERLSGEPAAIAARQTLAEQEQRAAEATWTEKAAALRTAERAAEEAAAAARQATAAHAGAREQAVRAEAGAEAADAACTALAAQIAERLGAETALPDPPAGDPAETEPRAQRRLEKLQREREEMGPVNLRAEIEVAETEERMATLEREREEIGTAIHRLRGAIGHLNREGRERLSAVLADVDRHFQTLFTTLFGGGRAHLALVGSDDPLQAGLEVYAQPPGKKLSALSLLSGGEQALTALSLLFAVFRCTPAPLCVLDEVDAPLDDANVGRFCDLLEEMVRQTGTRFLVVTHHPLTMARMDRLFGVTMQERGVSRLLSVDLRTAVELAEQPLAAE